MLDSIKSKVMLYKLFLSYFLIFVIPLIILTGILYKTSVIDLQKEIENSNMHKLMQLRDIIDTRMKELEYIALKINTDTRLTPFKMSSSAITQIEGIEKLGIYLANNAFIDNLYLYFSNTNSVFSPSGQYSSEAFTKFVYGFDNKEDEEMFLNNINTISKPTITMSKKINYNTDINIDLVTYFYPISFSEGMPKAVLFFAIRKSMFDKMIKDLLGDLSGSAFIFDKDKNVLASISNEDLLSTENNLSMVSMYDFPGVYSAQNDGKNISLIKTTSEYTGWDFAVTIETSQFFKKAVYMRNMILQIVLSIFAFGIFIIILFARNNYKPIRRLVGYINMQWPQTNKNNNMNEIDHISNVVNIAIKENKDLKDQIDLQMPLVEDQILTRLLKGEYTDEKKVIKMLNTMNIKLNGPQYSVIILNRYNGKDGILSGKYRDNVLKIIKQHLSAEEIAYAVELLHNNAIALISNLVETEFVKEYQEQIVNEMNYIIEKELGEEIIIGVGKPCSSILQLNRSFVEAFAVLENNILIENKKVLYFDDITGNQKQLYWYPTADQLRFIQSLKQGEKPIALEALHDIGNSISEKEASLQMLRYVCFDIVNMVIKTMNEMNIYEFNSDIEKIMQFVSLNDLQQRLEILTVKICEYVNERKNCKVADLHKRILDFVNLNFVDVNLSLEIVSEEFSLSTYYLSRLFKEITGFTFTDYITNLRMHKAKNMLVGTNAALKDIIMGIGYIDLASFIRKFKKLEGITPGEYRKNNSNKSHGSNNSYLDNYIS